MSAESEFGKAYDQALGIAHSDKHIHLDTVKRHPAYLKVGAWVMYLPLEVTENANMVPRMSQVVGVTKEGEFWTIITTLGVMRIKEGESIQEVA